MSLFKRVLTVISYVAVVGAPVLAATGVGMPIAAASGAVGVASGAWLHFLGRAPRSSRPPILSARRAVVDRPQWVANIGPTWASRSNTTTITVQG